MDLSEKWGTVGDCNTYQISNEYAYQKEIKLIYLSNCRIHEFSILLPTIGVTLRVYPHRDKAKEKLPHLFASWTFPMFAPYFIGLVEDVQRKKKIGTTQHVVKNMVFPVDFSNKTNPITSYTEHGWK